MKKSPHPGSKEAMDSGCTCPVADNHHGKGYGGNGEKYGWIQNEDCPLHSPEGKLRKDDRQVR